jgi:hypothetical protein
MRREKIFFTVIFLISIIIFVSCAKKQEEYKSPTWNKEVKTYKDMFKVFNKEYDIRSKIVVDDTAHINEIFYITLYDNYILIRELRPVDGFLYRVFDKNTGKFRNDLMRSGKGPNEFIDPFLFSDIKNDRCLLLDYVINNYLYIFNKNNPFSSTGIYDKKISLKKENKANVLYNLFPLYDEYIMSGEFTEGAYHVFDKNGNFKYSFGIYPKTKGKKLNNMQLGYRYAADASFAFNYKLNRLAVSNGKDFQLYKYDKKKDKFSLLFEAQWTEQDFPTVGYTKEGRPYAISWSDKEDGEGTNGLRANDEYIFLGFSKYNTHEADLHNIDAIFGYIFVMDWNGNPVCRLKLDRAIYCPFEIDNKGKNIYCAYTDTTTGFDQIIKYDVSNIDELLKKQAK